MWPVKDLEVARRPRQLKKLMGLFLFLVHNSTRIHKFYLPNIVTAILEMSPAALLNLTAVIDVDKRATIELMKLSQKNSSL